MGIDDRPQEPNQIHEGGSFSDCDHFLSLFNDPRARVEECWRAIFDPGYDGDEEEEAPDPIPPLF